MGTGVSCISGYRGLVAVSRQQSRERPTVRIPRRLVAAALVLAGMSAAGLAAGLAEDPERPDVPPVVVETADLPHEAPQP